MMIAKVAKWGNSLGVRIPKPMLEVIGVSDNDDVEIIAENKTLILRPVRERLTLEDIFRDWSGEKPESFDWGESDTPLGRELQ